MSASTAAKARKGASPAPGVPAGWPASIADLLEQGPEERQVGLASRIERLLSVLGLPQRSGTDGLLGGLDRVLAAAQPTEVWLALAVIVGQLPGASQVHRLLRASRLGEGLQDLFRQMEASRQVHTVVWPDVEVVTGKVVVDLHHTARNLFATGIQRVSREAARRWSRDHEVVLTGWTYGYRAYRRLSEEESAAALYGRSSTPGRLETSVAAEPIGALPPSDVVVPWRCVHIVPELPAEPERARRYQGFVTFSESTTGLIGHDCVPLMAAETCAEGMALGFATFLAAAARIDRIATVSRTAAVEFGGWRAMLAASGQPGPDIQPIRLGVEVRTPTEADLDEARRLLCIDSLPLVLAVGSHEPRKNQVSILQAAEMLWRQGLEFTLTFIGGNSWNSAEFHDQVQKLQAVNRPIQVILALSDELLWAAYRLAHCTVFPSLHEGFGLPVVESLASGTPVITSNLGSMSESARAGGAMLVDPRDDRQIANALRELLINNSYRDDLAAEASNVAVRTWDEYASETWDYLVEGHAPGEAP